VKCINIITDVCQSSLQYPLFFLKCKEIPDEKRQQVIQAYDILEKFLEGSDYVAGDHYTIADFCCVSTVSTLVVSFVFIGFTL
jgi:glutathione S-transferase